MAFWAMLIGNILMLTMGLLGIKVFSRIIEIPKKIIVPIIISLSIVGAYAMNNSIFDIWVALAFGVIGYIMQK